MSAQGFGSENDFVHACYTHAGRQHEKGNRVFWEKLYWMALQYKERYEEGIRKALPGAAYFLKCKYKQSIEIWVQESLVGDSQLCESICIADCDGIEHFYAAYSTNEVCLESKQKCLV